MKYGRVLTLTLFFVGAAFAQDQTASAPPCFVGQKLEFRYDDGGSFSRVIASREDDLCVVDTARQNHITTRTGYSLR